MAKTKKKMTNPRKTSSLNSFKGHIQVYTGDGKGKTTASMGLAIRAIGAGFKVLFAQFMKSGDYNEIRFFSKFGDNINIMQFGSGSFVFGKPSEKDYQMAAEGLKKIEEIISQNIYNIIILDEINVVLSKKLLEITDFMAFLDRMPSHIEIILTGRNAPKEIIDRADLVTEMLAIKHYYEKGVAAREGIEK
jgi:cob(I)alamin adenosyltransferase